MPGVGGPGIPLQPPPPPPPCATGFNEVVANGSSVGTTIVCKTSPITCPPAPKGLNGGLTNPTDATSKNGSVVVFSYTCQWTATPP